MQSLAELPELSIAMLRQGCGVFEKPFDGYSIHEMDIILHARQCALNYMMGVPLVAGIQSYADNPMIDYAEAALWQEEFDREMDESLGVYPLK